MKRIEFGGQIHEFPDDFSDDEISAALSSESPRTMMGRGGPIAVRRETPSQFAGNVTGAFPLAGALIMGGMGAAGGPTSPATVPSLAGLGAAGGEAFRQHTNRALNRMFGLSIPVPETPLQASMAMGTQAAIGVGSEFGGQAVTGMAAKAAPTLARWLYSSGLRVPAKVAGEFGDVAATGLRERIPVGEAQKFTGSAKARGALKGSTAERDAIIAGAQQAGFAKTPMEIADELAKTVHEMVAASAPVQESRAYAEQIGRFLDREGAHLGKTIDVTRLKQIKMRSQRIADRLYKAGADIKTVKASTDEVFNRDLANVTQRMLEEVQGLGAAESKVRGHLGLLKAMKLREQVPPDIPFFLKWREGIRVPFLSSPSTLTRAGIAVDRGALNPLGRRAAVAGRALQYGASNLVDYGPNDEFWNQR